VKKYLVGIVIGAVVGTAVGFVVKCVGSTWPTASSPWSWSIVGAATGLMLGHYAGRW